jgi:hypothetical protein
MLALVAVWTRLQDVHACVEVTFGHGGSLTLRMWCRRLLSVCFHNPRYRLLCVAGSWMRTMPGRELNGRSGGVGGHLGGSSNDGFRWVGLSLEIWSERIYVWANLP